MAVVMMRCDMAFIAMHRPAVVAMIAMYKSGFGITYPGYGQHTQQ